MDVTRLAAPSPVSPAATVSAACRGCTKRRILFRRAGGAEARGPLRAMSQANDIRRAAQVLRSGGLLAFPTETVYGLGADAENVHAVQRIFEVKGRPPTHPLIVHIGASDELARWAAEVPEAAKVLAERFWPGPLTLVLPRSDRVPLAVTGGLDTVALRVPDHPLALALLRSFGGAVAAPSANRFGSVSPTTARHVREDLGPAVDFVLDGGPCVVGVESTIVDLSTDQPVILRPGGIPREEIERALGCALPVHTGTTVRAPGQHPSHYAPRAEVVLVSIRDLDERARRLHDEGHRVGVLMPAPPGSVAGAGGICPAARSPRARPGRSPRPRTLPSGERWVAELPDGVVVLGKVRSVPEYARRLYENLRAFDRHGCDVVLASLPPEDGLGLAIADRLRRAAGERDHETRSQIADSGCCEP